MRFLDIVIREKTGIFFYFVKEKTQSSFSFSFHVYFLMKTLVRFARATRRRVNQMTLPASDVISNRRVSDIINKGRIKIAKVALSSRGADLGEQTPHKLETKATISALGPTVSVCILARHQSENLLQVKWSEATAIFLHLLQPITHQHNLASWKRSKIDPTIATPVFWPGRAHG
jgi:hypothetical protein